MRSALDAQWIHVDEIRTSAHSVEILYATSFSERDEFVWILDLDIPDQVKRPAPGYDLALLVFLIDLAPSWYRNTRKDVYIHLPAPISEEVAQLFFLIFGFGRRTSHRFHFTKTTYRSAHAISSRRIPDAPDSPSALDLHEPTSNIPVNDRLLAALFKKILITVAAGESVLEFHVPSSSFWTARPGFPYYNAWPGHPRFLGAVNRALSAVFDIRIEIVNPCADRHIVEMVLEDSKNLQFIREFSGNEELFDDIVSLTAVSVSQGIEAGRARLENHGSPALLSLVSGLGRSSPSQRRVALLDLPWSFESYFPSLSLDLISIHNESFAGSRVLQAEQTQLTASPMSEFESRFGVARLGLETWRLPNWGRVG